VSLNKAAFCAIDSEVDQTVGRCCDVDRFVGAAGRGAGTVDVCFASQNYSEGRRAFMEKRKPRFSGV
jgi:hypothetical protein